MRTISANLVQTISIFLVITVFASFALAQSAADDLKNNLTETETGAAAQTRSISDGKNELSIQGGFAPDIPRVFGGSRRSKFGFAALRYSRHLIGSRNVALKYTIDFIPLAVISYEQEPVVQTAPGTFVTQRNPQTAYAVGVTPIGLQLNFRRQKKVQPFLSANAGLLRFNKTIPDDRSAVFPNNFGRQFNYTLAGGGGVEFLTDNGKSFTFGFKFHHISNASTGNINPGFDQNLFYVGYTFKKW
jgi:hypothetical protein